MEGRVYRLYLEGRDLQGPEDLPLKDLAVLLDGLGGLLEAFALEHGYDEPLPASLVGVRKGSVALEVSVSAALPLEEGLFLPLEEGQYHRLGPKTREKAYILSKELVKEDRTLKLERGGKVKPLLGAAHPVPAPTPPLVLEDVLTLYGEVIRLGGVEPKVDLRTPRGEYHIRARREDVKRLEEENALYREIGVRVRARIAREEEGWKVLGHPELLEVLPYRPGDPREAFMGLARLVEKSLRGVDPEEHVRRLRG
ncbi:hypothetical protein CSW29_04305 [Thermus scotoductus]|uniref:Uncharacterized protein n=1 Tax=Thermus scotoductus TaxID=37636 RepID=A0A430UI22_THESC|nr:hypothetical protein [Thermus scotoductus]RTI01358.1 hypothetical protein CSW29_04305 [Thermus scotoductus]